MSRKAVQTELKKCTVSAKSHRLDVLCKINMGYDETTKNYNKKIIRKMKYCISKIQEPE